MKHFLSLALAFSLLGAIPVAGTQAAVKTANGALLNIYGDYMLFACNKPVTLAGTAAPGALITAQLRRGDEVVRTGSSTVPADGFFTLSMPGMDGGYTEYDLFVFASGSLIGHLRGVVFGLLWLASGQSNMQYPLSQTREGVALAKTGGTDPFIRALDTPSYPEYNGSQENIPFEPLNDIQGAAWCTGTQTNKLLNISAVAYFFAEVLRREADMPVGILNASLGGSSIYSWLPRAGIDSDAAVKEYLVSAGRYLTQAQWTSGTRSHQADMTANYNKKIYALRHFEPDGMIWYQGESDVGAPAAYADAMDLMQREYSRLFGYTDAAMPFVFTQIASFRYGDKVDDLNLVGNFNIGLGEIQAAHPASRAMTTIYDVPLDWDLNTIEAGMDPTGFSHPIHPIVKKPVGEKMATAALGLVYGRPNTPTAARPSHTEIRDGAVYVTFADVGDGLSVKPYNFTGNLVTAPASPLYGFAIAGENGVYTEARAEIVAPNAVKIWSDSVPAPVSATYAFAQVNNYANLFATHDGNFALSVCPFVTRRLADARYTQDKYWTTCDFDTIFRALDKPAYFPAFRAVSPNAAVGIIRDDVFDGTGALRVDYTIQSEKSRVFSFGPALTYNKNLVLPTAFPSIDRDYSPYGSVSFKLKNLSDRPLQLKELRFYTSAVSWYSPVAGTAVTIPADNAWHTVTLDLNKLCLYGDENGFFAGRRVLDKVFDIRLVFGDNTAAKGDAGALLADDFQFAPAATEEGGFVLRNVLTAAKFVFAVFLGLGGFLKQ